MNQSIVSGRGLIPGEFEFDADKRNAAAPKRGGVVALVFEASAIAAYPLKCEPGHPEVG